MFNFSIKAEQNRCYSEFSDDIQWNTTLAGTTKREQCPPNQKGDSLEVKIHKVNHFISDDQLKVLPHFLHIKTYMHIFSESFHNLRLFFMFSASSADKDLYLFTSPFNLYHNFVLISF